MQNTKANLIDIFNVTDNQDLEFEALNSYIMQEAKRRGDCMGFVPESFVLETGLTTRDGQTYVVKVFGTFEHELKA